MSTAGPMALRHRHLILPAVGLAWLLLHIAMYQGGETWGYDYRAYHDAAVRLRETGTLYQAVTLDGPFRPGPFGLYMYAPPLGVALLPATDLPLSSAIMVWFILHVVGLALACALIPVRPTVRLAVFGAAALSYAVTKDVALGNVNLVLLVFLALAWRRLDEPLGSIAQAVAMAIRPMLGVLLIWQALRRRWAAVAWTLGAGIVLVALTLPIVGWGGYSEYLSVLRNMSEVTGVRYNHDMATSALILGFDDPVPTLLLLAGYVTGLGAILLSLRRDREVGFVVTATASLLLSPLLWDHYLVMLILPTALLVERGHRLALLLPLLVWLPGEVYPWLVILATLLPLWARDKRLQSDSERVRPTPRRTRAGVTFPTATPG